MLGAALIACLIALAYYKKQSIHEIYNVSDMSRFMSVFRPRSATADELGTANLANNPELNAELTSSVVIENLSFS